MAFLLCGKEGVVKIPTLSPQKAQRKGRGKRNKKGKRLFGCGLGERRRQGSFDLRTIREANRSPRSG
jgi:hypothetical protein